MNRLSINEKIGPNYVLLELNGDINAYTLLEFQEKLYSLILDTNIVLDMTMVSSLDSSGLGVILATINDSEENDTKLFIMNPSESSHKALTRSGFWSTFNIIHSVTEVAS